MNRLEYSNPTQIEALIVLPLRNVLVYETYKWIWQGAPKGLFLPKTNRLVYRTWFRFRNCTNNPQNNKDNFILLSITQDALHLKLHLTGWFINRR